jgi:NSS family neurotransmitter:Na+ symporter
VLQVVSAAVQEKFGMSARGAAVGVGLVSAVLSVLLFSTTTGLLALDVADQWANNIGIVASAVLATVLAIWVLRRGAELRYHLNAVSTFQVGRIWIVLVGVLAPVILGWMLIQRIITLIVEGYGGLPGWYLGVVGWGTIAFIVVVAVVLPMLRWRTSPDDFTAWPSYPPPGVTAGARRGGREGTSS